MTSLFRHLLAGLLLLALTATACGSSSDSADADADTQVAAETDEAEADGDTDADTEGDADAPDPDSTSIPVPDDDAAAADAIAGLDGETPAESVEQAPTDRATTALAFVRNLFNIDPEAEAISCIVAQSPRDEVLDAALQSSAVAAGQVDDPQMRALTVAMNGCIETLSLADWAVQAIGPQGDVQQTGPPCLVERFDDPERGDITFYNFTALTYQYRLEPTGVEDLIDALATCAPITSLSDFFASQAEQASGFETVVDRDCLTEALSPAQVSEDFWDAFVTGETPPVQFINTYTEECAETAGSDLALTVPDDFVAWSGTGSLAAVRPSARAGAYSAPPPMSIDATATYEAVLATGGGEIRLRLFADTAPITVNNFVSLARDGYFDGTVFHRVLDQFMAQGGDPTGTGSGGPGYQFEDEFDGGPALDRKGLLAMANIGPDTNGSQFFITFVETDWLTGKHTVFGEVIEGIELVDAIELRDPDAATSRGQVVESVTIIES